MVIEILLSHTDTQHIEDIEATEMYDVKQMKLSVASR